MTQAPESVHRKENLAKENFASETRAKLAQLSKIRDRNKGTIRKIATMFKQLNATVPKERKKPRQRSKLRQLKLHELAALEAQAAQSGNYDPGQGVCYGLKHVFFRRDFL